MEGLPTCLICSEKRNRVKATCLEIHMPMVIATLIVIVTIAFVIAMIIVRSYLIAIVVAIVVALVFLIELIGIVASNE